MIKLPSWLKTTDFPQTFNTLEDKMNFVISLAQKNIQNQTGGPFAAAIFNTKTNELISIGLNLVTSLNQSTLHAEVVAIMEAQTKLKTFDLKSHGSYELITSTEPCVMCLGAIIWSGITKLICGSQGQDAEKIGCDEGPKPKNWPQELEKRGIEVKRNVRRVEAKKVLELYKNNNGIIY